MDLALPTPNLTQHPYSAVVRCQVCLFFLILVGAGFFSFITSSQCAGSCFEAAEVLGARCSSQGGEMINWFPLKKKHDHVVWLRFLETKAARWFNVLSAEYWWNICSSVRKVYCLARLTLLILAWMGASFRLNNRHQLGCNNAGCLGLFMVWLAVSLFEICCLRFDVHYFHHQPAKLANINLINQSLLTIVNH